MQHERKKIPLLILIPTPLLHIAVATYTDSSELKPQQLIPLYSSLNLVVLIVWSLALDTDAVSAEIDFTILHRDQSGDL
jgi:hypothetical protein